MGQPILAAAAFSGAFSRLAPPAPDTRHCSSSNPGPGANVACPVYALLRVTKLPPLALRAFHPFRVHAPNAPASGLRTDKIESRGSCRAADYHTRSAALFRRPRVSCPCNPTPPSKTPRPEPPTTPASSRADRSKTRGACRGLTNSGAGSAASDRAAAIKLRASFFRCSAHAGPRAPRASRHRNRRSPPHTACAS